MRTLIRTHWEGVVMALLMTVAFSLAGMLDEPPPTATAKDDGRPTAYASKD